MQYSRALLVAGARETKSMNLPVTSSIILSWRKSPDGRCAPRIHTAHSERILQGFLSPATLDPSRQCTDCIPVSSSRSCTRLPRRHLETTGCWARTIAHSSAAGGSTVSFTRELRQSVLVLRRYRATPLPNRCLVCPTTPPCRRDELDMCETLRDCLRHAPWRAGAAYCQFVDRRTDIGQDHQSAQAQRNRPRDEDQRTVVAHLETLRKARLEERTQGESQDHQHPVVASLTHDEPQCARAQNHQHVKCAVAKCIRADQDQYHQRTRQYRLGQAEHGGPEAHERKIKNQQR